MQLSEVFIDDVRKQTNIVDIIGQYVSLQKKGNNFFGCCPFHNEHTPSFSVSQEKQIFYCFGCHESGNVFSFLMKHLGMSFPESVLQLAKEAHMDVSQFDGQLNREEQTVLKNQALYDMMQFVTEFYQFLLLSDKGKIAREYLYKRGLTDDDIEYFQIGYAPKGVSLKDLLLEKGYALEVAKQLNLIHQTDDLLATYDTFSQRIIFPIQNNRGNVVAFTGRLIVDVEDRPKYYHSKESPIFQKREILYHVSQAMPAIKQKKNVYVCEGIFDVIALFKSNYKNVVATLGTALTNEQLKLLRKNDGDITLAFDNDNPGKKAILKALIAANQEQKPLKALSHWQMEEKDFDEVLQNQGVEGIDRILRLQIDDIDYVIQYYKTWYNLNNNENKQEFAKKIIEFSQYKNLATQEHYLRIIQELTGYSQLVIDDFMQQTKKKKLQKDYHYQIKADYNPDIHVKKKVYNRREKCELMMIKCITYDLNCMKHFYDYPVFTQHTIFRNIVYALFDLYLKNKYIEISSLYQILNINEQQFFTQALHLEEPVDFNVYQSLLKTLKKEAELEHAKTVLQHAENQEENVDAAQKLLDLKRKQMIQGG